MSIRNLILDFLYKFFFILKAAADGTIISYIGGNKFEFKSRIIPKSTTFPDYPTFCHENVSSAVPSNLFISKYSKNIPLFILKK